MPRVFIAPQRYVQGRGVLREVGRYLAALMRVRRVAVLLSARTLGQEGKLLLAGLDAAGIEAVPCAFAGECSIEEVDRHVASCAGARIECVVAAGGGKCIDTGKVVADRLGVPVVIVPTLASNDAPCSALSVLYTPAGVVVGAEFQPNSPALVVVDTDVIAAAPERYLVAGMGDAMATWYEARVCLLNPAATSMLGARPTLAASAIGEICAKTLFESGVAAAAAAAAGTVNEALETVVEANTLLSGLGFESGGLAVAHAIAQCYTAIPRVHDRHLHGEMVAMGTLAQLVMEARADEATRVAAFFAAVGLPIHLGQLSMDERDGAALALVSGMAPHFPFAHNMPLAVTAERVEWSIREAHRIGSVVARDTGDEAYRRLHAGTH